jgi:hypothetical protein
MRQTGKNRRCVLFVRGATANSQLKKLRRLARARRMGIVDEVCLQDISSTDSQLHDTIEGLIERKQMNDDFDVIVVTNLDRLGRGVLEGLARLMNLRKAGINVLTLDGSFLDTSVPSIFNFYLNGKESRRPNEKAREEASTTAVPRWMSLIRCSRKGTAMSSTGPAAALLNRMTPTGGTRGLPAKASHRLAGKDGRSRAKRKTSR